MGIDGEGTYPLIVIVMYRILTSEEGHNEIVPVYV